MTYIFEAMPHASLTATTIAAPPMNKANACTADPSKVAIQPRTGTVTCENTEANTNKPNAATKKLVISLALTFARPTTIPSTTNTVDIHGFDVYVAFTATPIPNSADRIAPIQKAHPTSPVDFFMCL